MFNGCGIGYILFKNRLFVSMPIYLKKKNVNRHRDKWLKYLTQIGIFNNCKEQRAEKGNAQEEGKKYLLGKNM